MKKYLVEFIGTFFFVFIIGMVVIAPGAGALAPLPIGCALMVMVFAGGHISGGHYNPAVTLAAVFAGALNARHIPGYMIAQIAGAMLAAVVVSSLKGDMAMAAIEPLRQVAGPALLAEFIVTFALCWVVLNVAAAKGTFGNSFYGLAIGFTVLTGAFAVGSISGGAFNPAVAVGLSGLGISEWSKLWIYLVANFAGAGVAAAAFKYLNPVDVDIAKPA